MKSNLTDSAIPEAAGAVVAAHAASEKKAEDVIAFEVGEVLAITGQFVVASGANPRHVRTIAEAVEEALKGFSGRGPDKVEGMAEGLWVLMDYGDFVVHIFDAETRRYYGLERLWGDAERIDWQSWPDPLAVSV